ncbi:MAG TPA: carbohydrate-binding protein [Vicinamibacterales bacterium]|nr:carbohydrate-binding protein [Vicinamibacterales bacterium]
MQQYTAAGVPIHRITPQNEPLNTSATYPTMSMDATQQATFIAGCLAPALAQAGLSTQIATYDQNWDNTSYSESVLASAAGPSVSGSAWHCYAGSPDAMTNVHTLYPAQDIYFTECSAGDWNTSFASNLKWDMENLILGAPLNWARTITKWNIALDSHDGPQNGGCPNCTGLVTIDQSSGTVTYNVDYYTLGHASKFVVPGARRIASTSFEAGGIEDVAFRNPDGSIALIVLNADAVSRAFKVRVGSDSFLYELPASGVATFTWRDGGQWTNQPPTVVLTAPTNGTSYVDPASMTVSATASDPDGYITAVKFYAGSSLVGSSSTPPYTITWSAVPVGVYSLTAVATDNLGANSTSASVSVTVVPPGTRSTPFSGTPVNVPGVIEAANFDNGGEGISYHDTTLGNAGGQFRSTDVDIETCIEGGYDIGWIDAGEWLNYTVKVTAAGDYTVQLRVASLAAATMHVGFNGPSEGQWKTVSIPATGGWQNWTSINVSVTLGAGVQQMTVLFDTGGMNLESAMVTNASNTTLTPFSGTPVPLPGQILAANFDNGGESVAYHDTTPGNTGGAYRNTDVDLEESSEGGYDVGWIDAGEWLNYTVNVTTAGNCTVQLRVASPSGGASLHVGFNGPSEGTWKTVSIPATGGWQNWTTVSVPVTLGLGVQQMTLYFDTAGLNVLWTQVGP